MDEDKIQELTGTCQVGFAAGCGDSDEKSGSAEPTGGTLNTDDAADPKIGLKATKAVGAPR